MEDDTPLNDLPDMPDKNQGGYAINLIVAVKDHAPPRIDNIEKEVADLQNRIKELETERALLIKLLQVVQSNE